jgi:UDP-GlcNAc3NAcA epimerase
MIGPQIALCYGTRPQVIKASVLRRELSGVGTVHAIDTGQHYDYALNALLYQQLGVSPPDEILEVGSADHAPQTAAILVRAEQVFRDRRPDVVVVIGDTNSTLGCALAAAKLRLPVVHVEAGLRALDSRMAEEINRRAVDAFADLLCTPSARATARVRAERSDALICETGDVAYDVLRDHADHLPRPESFLPTGITGPYYYATLHRAELTDRPALLLEVLQAMAELARPVVLALHPRTRTVLDAYAPGAATRPGLSLVPALGYLESLALTRGAELVITDSGGVQREAYWLGTPCITMRPETEWAETVELEANRTLDPLTARESLAEAARRQVDRWAGLERWNRAAYGCGDAAERVAGAIRPLVVD